METKNISFKNRNGIELSARLDLPAGNPTSFAIFAHCLSCSKNSKAAYHISHCLAKKEIAVLRFDFTGLGESGGDFKDTNFTSNVSDIIDAAEYLKQDYEAPQLLIGHSLGGTAVIKAAGEIRDCKAVAVINSPYKPSHIEKSISDLKGDEYTEHKIKFGTKELTITKQFIDDIRSTEIENDLKILRKALLIMHAPLDNTVSIENASHIFTSAKHPKSFISLDDADHLLSEKRDSEYSGKVIAEWASRYIEAAEIEKPEMDTENKVVVQTGPDSYKTDIFTGRHHMIADEPISLGGTDMGPNPYDFLLASLGACTTLTVKLYADRKNWDLYTTRVIMDHKKIYAEDCKECETKTGKIDFIDRQIEFIGNLDEEQRKRLAEIADKCPVHKTLHSEIVVKTKLIE